VEPGNPYRPRVSRETRLLLTAGVLAVAALWLLARIRFDDRPVTPNPVPSVLSQLASGPKYDDLAAEIVQLHARLEPSLLALDVPSAAGESEDAARRIAALRIRDDLVVALLPAGPHRAAWNGVDVRARDPASGLAVVRVPGQAAAPPPMPWTPRRPQQPRYLIATEVSSQGVSLRPAFVGSLDPIDSPLWSEPLWAVPARSDLTPGLFLFTNNAELAGLLIEHGGERAIVPGGTVLAEADRLVEQASQPAGTIGVEVQALTPPLASVTGASVGVVVAWVDSQGAARGKLVAGDVIEAVDSRTVTTRQHWDVRVARLSVGETIMLRVRRRGELREVAVAASAPAVPPASRVNRSLGLTMRRRTGIGTEVVRVDQPSAADRAGISAGDLITLFGDVQAPTPARITRSFVSLRQGQRVLIAVTRGDAHRVMTLER
jgi:hypothetical protein